MSIRGIVFDKDGTLFDYRATWADWCEGLLAELSAGDAALAERLARACGFDLAARDFVAGSLIVNGTAAEVLEAWAPHLPGWSLEALDARARAHVARLQNRPVCDLEALFGTLRGRGLRLGLATNDYEAAAHHQLAQAGLGAFFDFVCGYDSGHGAKPGPGMISVFCREMDLAPENVAMVGDSTHDLAAGRAAGAGLVVGVLTGPAGRDELAALADVILQDISELPALLDAR